VTGEAGRTVDTLTGSGGVGRTLDDVGGTVGLKPTKTVKDLSSGNARKVTKDLGKTVGNAPKAIGKTVKDAPKTVKEVTKPVPKKLTAPKEVRLPGGTSVKTGEAGRTGPSITPPQTQALPALPTVQLPPLPQTTGLGL
jgi:hypothetical protein